METSKILSANLLDIIFDDRNKDYGAYELRKTYQKRITKALLVTGTITLLIFGSLLARSPKPESKNAFVSTTVNLTNIKDEKEPDIPKPKKPEVEQVRTEQFINKIEIKPDNEVQQTPPTQDDLKIADIGDQKIDGVNPDGLQHSDVIKDDKGVIEIKQEKEPDIFTAVEVDAKFNGNWGKFLTMNLNPNIPVDNGAPAGTYKIIIQFVVDLDGSLSDIKALTNYGYGMEQEAIRVVKRAKGWEPAFQNGRHVKAYRTQPITFVVTEE